MFTFNKLSSEITAKTSLDGKLDTTNGTMSEPFIIST